MKLSLMLYVGKVGKCRYGRLDDRQQMELEILIFTVLAESFEVKLGAMLRIRFSEP